MINSRVVLSILYVIIIIVYYARRHQNHTDKTPKTQNYTTVHTSNNDKTPLKHHIKVQIITDDAKLHHIEGSQIIQIKTKQKLHNITYKKK